VGQGPPAGPSPAQKATSAPTNFPETERGRTGSVPVPVPPPGSVPAAARLGVALVGVAAPRRARGLLASRPRVRHAMWVGEIKMSILQILQGDRE